MTTVHHDGAKTTKKIGHRDTETQRRAENDSAGRREAAHHGRTWTDA
jgi:hypothetical protein